jgi:peptidoglycan/xylan/chitin deacetylase (PgdA/CDA1 family)
VNPSGVATIATAALLCSAAAPVPPATPNELGRVPILCYHRIDEPEARWTRTPANLRADLEQLWTRGYRPVALRDLVAGRIDVPRGMTPVVLTFDDSSPGQFRYVERDGKLVIDPRCAIGILEAFAREHPGFRSTATFYVLPQANPPNRMFNQPAYATQKLRYLSEHGYEIGNHTLWHADLSRYAESTVREQIARAQEWIGRAVPGYQVRTLALPMGSFPRNVAWAIDGQDRGVKYHNDAILRVVGGASASPYASGFDPYRLPRIQATGAELARLFAYYEKHPELRFVSDGSVDTITVPVGTARDVAPAYRQRAVER